MLSITMPPEFKIGSTNTCRINGQPATLIWKDKDTMIVSQDGMIQPRPILFAVPTKAGTQFAILEADDSKDNWHWDGTQYNKVRF